MGYNMKGCAHCNNMHFLQFRYQSVHDISLSLQCFLKMNHLLKYFIFLGHCDPRSAKPCRGVHPCDTSYAGLSPFSEVEARNIADFLYSHKDSIKLYLSLHSYSQLWLTPWGYTDQPPNDIHKLVSILLFL